MAAKNIQKYQELDPELAALFEPSNKDPKVHEPTVEAKTRADATGEDALLTLKELAEAQQAKSRKRSELEPGFDTVENDLSNVLSVGWDFITRP